MKRQYRRIKIKGGVIQYQVITPVGNHWRHIAVVTVKSDQVSKAERYFFSTRAPQIILPFEAMGKDFLVNAIKNHKNHLIVV